MKSLKNVQLIAKILLILTTVGFWLTLIGAAGALLGGSLLLTIAPFLGEELTNLIVAESGIADLSALGISLIAECVFLVGMVVSLWYTMQYLRAEQKDGTPFTHKGAALLLRTAIINLAVPVGAIIVASLITAISGVDNMLSNEWEIVGGVTMLLLYFVFRYGADIAEGQKE